MDDTQELGDSVSSLGLPKDSSTDPLRLSSTGDEEHGTLVRLLGVQLATGLSAGFSEAFFSGVFTEQKLRRCVAWGVGGTFSFPGDCKRSTWSSVNSANC